MKLSAYHQFLLYNGNNPANKITGYNNRNAHYSSGRPNLWAAEFISHLVDTDALVYANEHTLSAWATIESLNSGSYQRTSLDQRVELCLRGSGRWQANDNGGHFKILRDKTLEWVLMNEDERKFWQALAITHDVWESDLKNYAYKTRLHREKETRFSEANVIFETSCWSVRKTTDNYIIVRVWNKNDYDHHTIMEITKFQYFDKNCLDGFGIDVETIKDIKQILDDNNCEIEISIYTDVDDKIGPWFFRNRED